MGEPKSPGGPFEFFITIPFNLGLGEEVELVRSIDQLPDRVDFSSLPQRPANASQRGSCGCILPFIYERRIYQVCSTLFDLNPWCATEGKESINAY